MINMCSSSGGNPAKKAVPWGISAPNQVKVGGRSLDTEPSLLVASDCNDGGDAFYASSAD